jgi:hypothetical protein
MKKVYLCAICFCVFGWLSSSTALADKKNGPRYKFFEKYDKNKNGKIDDDEKEAIRKDFAADPEGDLKRFDKNKNGKLEDDEIAAIKAPEDKKKSSKEKTDSSEKKGKSSKSDKTEKSSTGTSTNQTDKASSTTGKTNAPAKSSTTEKNP